MGTQRGIGCGKAVIFTSGGAEKRRAPSHQIHQMKQISFFPGVSATSILGYGTTSLMGAASHKERLALLECAFEHGITHYDTAPYYGYGEAERVLGEFLKGRRDKVTVTTKYGIMVTGVASSRWITTAARKVFQFAPGLKKLVRRGGPPLARRCAFTSEELRASLERSLSALGTDHVDLFLLHEPSLEDAASEELAGLLDDEVRRGTIRAYGCGGGPDIGRIAAANLPLGQWLQFEGHALSEAPAPLPLPTTRLITFGAFNSSFGKLRTLLASERARCDLWSQRLDLNCGDDEVLAALLQSAAHAMNPEGIVLFSSCNPLRIASAARIAEGGRFSSAQIQSFLELCSGLKAGSLQTIPDNS